MQSRTLRWYGVITLFLIVAISYIDRINIAVLITDPAFLDHMGIGRGDRVSQGLLTTAFLVGYGVSAIVLTPFCSTLLGVRRSLLAGLVLWGVVTFFSPHFHSFELLVASRVLLGVAEGPLFSLAGHYIKAYFATHENGKPNAFVNMGTGLGLAIGYPFIGYLVAGHDWQTSFHVLGIINIVVGIPLVLAFVAMPKTAPAQGADRAAAPVPPLVQVGRIVAGALKTRYLVLLTVMTAAFLSYLWGASSWLPAYLKEARGFSMREMGWLASLPQYATVLGVFLGGAIIDRIPRRQVPLMFVVCSIGVALAVLAAIESASPYGAAYSLVAASLCWGLMSPAYPSTVQYCAQPEHVASAYGVVNGVGSLVAGFMPAIMGAVITAVSGGAGSSTGAGFFAGFAALIGTQVVVLLCGLVLWVRERNAPGL
ncbi:MFS transporter [Ottowia sp.]|uniref:MFS transporter n=1 Tax=Ottowia sp. TaxID=1898956 RepID=UPI0039E41266